MLRDYQEEAIRRLRQSFAKGYKRPILRLGCGGGKTIIATEIARQNALKGHRTLFLTHLKEIKDQTIKTMQRFNVEADVETIIKASHKLDQYNPNLIICDECNFALSKTWRQVLDYFKDAYIIGLSASPVRLSGEAMGDIFDDIVEVVSEDDLIHKGYLSDYDLYAPKLDFSTENIHTDKGDFKEEELFIELNKPKIYGDVLKYYNKYADDRKTIIYCTTIEHSKRVAQEFCLAGYKAEHIDGTFSDNKRDAIIERFRTGETKILCNVNLISFGFDVPDCDCVVSLRPTQSLCLYIQQYCRCLRKSEDKERALILDFANNSYRFGLPTEKREWKLTGKIKTQNRNGEKDVIARQCARCFKVYSGTNRICPYCQHDNGKTRKQIEQEKEVELELFKKQQKQEIHKLKTLDELIAYAKARHFKNPYYWATIKYQKSWRKMYNDKRGKKDASRD